MLVVETIAKIRRAFLGNVETDCRDRLHDLAPSNRGGLSYTHIYGTHVPVEEVAVGTEITLRPPHRSLRALLTHRAPTLEVDEEPLLWPRMQDAWERQVPVRRLWLKRISAPCQRSIM